MALNCYQKIASEGNAIPGSCTQAGREDLIEIIGFSHEVISPRDAASGLPTGKRQHKPAVLTHELDKAYPLLMQALVNNENITEWKLDFWRPSKSGKEELYFVIELVNASIAGMRTEMLNNKYAENMKMMTRCHTSYCYQKITWTWQDGGITAHDDWETPVA